MERLVESFKSPEARASYAAEYILTSFVAAAVMSNEQREYQKQYLEDVRAPTSMFEELFQMPDAVRDLTTAESGEKIGIKFPRLHKRWSKEEDLLYVEWSPEREDEKP